LQRKKKGREFCIINSSKPYFTSVCKRALQENSSLVKGFTSLSKNLFVGNNKEKKSWNIPENPVKNAAAYASEWLVLLETFLKLKIRGFKSRVAYDGALTVIITDQYIFLNVLCT
jgi:hypothetical protein